MSLRESAKVLTDNDVALFMASADDIETNTRFAQKNQANFPILSDPQKTAANAYGVIASHGYPARWTFYIDPQGTLVYIDKNVKPATAGSDIAARLKALENG